MKWNVFPILFFAILLALLKADPAKSSVVLRVSFDQVVQGSELIFEGQVVSKEPRPSPINGKPFTYFTIQIIDVIKGSYMSPTIEIGFMGGQLGEFTLKVSDMRMPELGERGVYFVESLTEQQVHPFFGWHQGHYLVIPDQQTGIDRVIPVEEDTGKVNSLKSMQAPPTLEEFKQNVRKVMESE